MAANTSGPSSPEGLSTAQGLSSPKGSVGATSFRAVIFDLGGVVLGSPLHAIADYERELEIPSGTINRHVVASAPEGAWHRLERGELELGDQFFADFDQELKQAGHPIDTREMMDRIAQISQPRPQMITAIHRLREHTLTVAALTNNWTSKEAPGSENGYRRSELRVLFDHFIESSVVGLRKPDPEIYRYTCGLIGIEPQEAVFLDDIGTNLKSARRLGMTTIKVDDPDKALEQMWSVLALQ